MNTLITFGLSRCLLVAGALALVALTGCAPDTVDPSASRTTPASDASAAPTGDAGATPAPRDASSAAVTDAAPAAADRPELVAQDVRELFVADAPHATPAVPFDEEAFKSDLARATAGDDVASLPAVDVADDDRAFRKVLSIVAASANVSDDDVRVDPQACGGATQIDCAARFQEIATGLDASLANVLAPLAARMVPALEHVRVVLWKPTRDGITLSNVVTIHGTRSGHLVGIVVFR